MYNYENDTGRGRTYRPDLLPLITAWLAAVPESDWQYFVGFRVGTYGEFIAKFMKSPTRGGPLRLVTFVLDHDCGDMHTDTHVWFDRQPQMYSSRDLTLAVDTFP